MKILSFKSGSLLKELQPQRSKQEVTKVVSLYRDCRKHKGVPIRLKVHVFVAFQVTYVFAFTFQSTLVTVMERTVLKPGS